jgi:hypothetical protein
MATSSGDEFLVEGKVKLEAKESLPGDVKLMAHLFDGRGEHLGSGEIDPKGSFAVPVKLEQPADVELIVGPAGEARAVRKSAVYNQHFAAGDWVTEGRTRRLKPEITVARDIWWPWWPVQICVSGHVRKIETTEAGVEICPVPYVKVELFDVDRESCLWPFIRRWWDLLLDRPVVRIPQLFEERPFPPQPIPGPDPAPDFVVGPLTRAGRLGAGVAEALNPQPLPPRSSLADMVALNPQPEPPSLALKLGEAASAPQAAFARVGEAARLSPQLATRLDHLTLTSKVAPWALFPWCFYSKELVCETTTDCYGYFKCCFKWSPFHFRRGRLRFDLRPDIIVRVTQIINGVTTVLYMDPYTSTRWNVSNNAHIDLFLDNEEVVCGSEDCQDRPDGSPVFYTRVGDDEVYKINQTTGLYNQAPLSNVAYGASLLVYGQFGSALSTGSPKRYYRLSYARKGMESDPNNFTPVVASLSDTRVNKVTFMSEAYELGPKTVNGVPALYEVRDFSNYYWYNPDWLGTWHSWLAEEDTDDYLLRLEVFDENGAKLTSAMGVDYRDGTVPPPGPLPSTPDRCDLVITLDNKGPQLQLITPAVNDCGVIPWSPSLILNFSVQVSQENNRLRLWRLQYTKGTDATVHVLAGNVSNNGLPGSVSTSVSGAALLTGLSSTCAFALKLWAYPHVRNGRHFIRYDEKIQAIAIEKCS